MGLSNEERQFKLFNCLMGWRFQLQQLAKVVKDKKTIVEAWISELDLITGKEISKLEGSSLYWFCGPNETNYRSLFSATYHAKSKVEAKEPGWNSLSYYENKIDHVFFIQQLRGCGFEISDTANIIAHYWDMWSYVAAILYPALRYGDSLFDIDKIQSLIGKIANERGLLFQSWIRDEMGEFMQEETNLLCKLNLFKMEFEKFRNEKTSKKNGKAYFKVKDEVDFSADIKKLLTTIGNMSMGVVAKKISDFEQEKFENEIKYKQKTKEEPKKDALNPKIPSREELESIVKTSFYEDEVEEALAILNEELSTHCGLWNQWLDYVKLQTKIELELQKGE